MNACLCKYEQEATTALCFGPLSDELHAHVTGCAACSEVIFPAECLLRDADSMGEISIPDADLVWRERTAQSAQLMHASGLASMPLWAVSTSTGGTQLTKVRSEKEIQVSHGGTLFTSKNPFGGVFCSTIHQCLAWNK